MNKENEIDHEELVAHVMVEGDWIPMRDTTFLNNEEDIQGRDIVTFEYKNQIKQSFVTFKYIN